MTTPIIPRNSIGSTTTSCLVNYILFCLPLAGNASLCRSFHYVIIMAIPLSKQWKIIKSLMSFITKHFSLFLFVKRIENENEFKIKKGEHKNCILEHIVTNKHTQTAIKVRPSKQRPAYWPSNFLPSTFNWKDNFNIRIYWNDLHIKTKHKNAEEVSVLPFGCVCVYSYECLALSVGNRSASKLKANITQYKAALFFLIQFLRFSSFDLKGNKFILTIVQWSIIFE